MACDVAQFLPLGTSTVFSRTVTIEMIESFAEIIEDFDPIHFDTDIARQSRYGRRIAHGALVAGFMSSATTMLAKSIKVPVFSLGYDKMRFLCPVFPGDVTLSTIVVTGHDVAKCRIFSDIKVMVGNKLVAVATNILVVDG